LFRSHLKGYVEIVDRSVNFSVKIVQGTMVEITVTQREEIIALIVTNRDNLVRTALVEKYGNLIRPYFSR
jgi:hypothetical protein